MRPATLRRGSQLRQSALFKAINCQPSRLVAGLLAAVSPAAPGRILTRQGEADRPLDRVAEFRIVGHAEDFAQGERRHAVTIRVLVIFIAAEAAVGCLQREQKADPLADRLLMEPLAVRIARSRHYQHCQPGDPGVGVPPAPLRSRPASTISGPLVLLGTPASISPLVFHDPPQCVDHRLLNFRFVAMLLGDLKPVGSPVQAIEFRPPGPIF